MRTIERYTNSSESKSSAATHSLSKLSRNSPISAGVRVSGRRRRTLLAKQALAALTALTIFCWSFLSPGFNENSSANSSAIFSLDNSCLVTTRLASCSSAVLHSIARSWNQPVFFPCMLHSVLLWSRQAVAMWRPSLGQRHSPSKCTTPLHIHIVGSVATSQR